MPFGRLEVIIAEARNLKGGSFLDKADPYVTVSTDRQNIQKTSVIKNAGENASWNQNFFFDIVEGRNELYVQVYDENTGSDDLIGSTTIQLGPLFQSAFADAWFPITKQDGKNSGNVHLVMKFNSQGTAPGPGYTPPVYQGTPGFSSLGPQSGPIPTGYGVGTPPPPGQPGYPPAQPTGYYQQQQPYGTPQPPQQPYGAPQPGGYPGGPPPSDSGSPYGAPYGSQPTPPGSVPPPQSAGYSGQPTYPGSSPYGAPPQNASYGSQPPAVYPGSVAPSSSSSSSSKGNKGGTDWLATAGIGVAGAAALTGAAFLGKKLFDEHEEKKHEREDEYIQEEVRHSMNEYGQPHYGQPQHGGYEHERHEHKHEKHHHKHHHHY